MKLYSKTLKLKRGYTLGLNLLYACNLKCTYCSLEMPTGKRPTSKQSTLEQWKEYVKNFPCKLKEVTISGGEPTLIDWLPDLINWLLKEGYHVMLFTDLFNASLIRKVNPSYRFHIVSTFHHTDSQLRFESAYHSLKGFNIVVHEIVSELLGIRKRLSFSIAKPFNTMDVLKDDEFRVSPDLQLFISCYDHYLQKSK